MHVILLLQNIKSQIYQYLIKIIYTFTQNTKTIIFIKDTQYTNIMEIKSLFQEIEKLIGIFKLISKDNTFDTNFLNIDPLISSFTIMKNSLPDDTEEFIDEPMKLMMSEILNDFKSELMKIEGFDILYNKKNNIPIKEKSKDEHLQTIDNELSSSNLSSQEIDNLLDLRKKYM